MPGAALRIGFIPLIDAAPLIAALELGYFSEEGLNATLHRQVGWANIRDKLSFGHLDAAHTLLGMPLVSHLGRDSFHEPLLGLMELGAGGNAITVSKDLHTAGVSSAADLAAVIRSQPRFARLLIGHVFSSSMHHYLLRDWLASGGIDPDRDVKLCIIPPPQICDHMRGGYVDLFCAGEPWNSLATREGHGVSIVATTDILPRHPEKLLAVTSSYARQNAYQLVPMIRAILRACAWCQRIENRSALARMLAGPEYIAQPAELIEQSLSIGNNFGSSRHQKNVRPDNWSLRSFSTEQTFPNKMHFAWMLQQMIRWGHLSNEADVQGIAERCSDSTAYRTAAASLDIPCPTEDFVPMELRGGSRLALDSVTSTTALASAR